MPNAASHTAALPSLVRAPSSTECSQAPHAIELLDQWRCTCCRARQAQGASQNAHPTTLRSCAGCGHLVSGTIHPYKFASARHTVQADVLAVLRSALSMSSAQCTKAMARASSAHTTPLHLSSFSSCSHCRPSSPPQSAAQYPKVMAREARASNAHTPLRLSFFKSLEDLYPNPPVNVVFFLVDLLPRPSYPATGSVLNRR